MLRNTQCFEGWARIYHIFVIFNITLNWPFDRPGLFNFVYFLCFSDHFSLIFEGFLFFIFCLDIRWRPRTIPAPRAGIVRGRKGEGCHQPVLAPAPAAGCIGWYERCSANRSWPESRILTCWSTTPRRLGGDQRAFTFALVVSRRVAGAALRRIA